MKVEPQTQVSVSDELISFEKPATKTRSATECISKCMMSFPFDCTSVFRDDNSGNLRFLKLISSLINV